MRIRRLPFVFALFLANVPAPLHAALGVAPRCVPDKPAPDEVRFADASSPSPGLQAPSVDTEGRDFIIKTIAFEASGEPDEGKAAVAHVILNRKRLGRWGDSVKDVVTHPWQFEPWMTKRGEMDSLSEEDPRYQDAARIADAVLAGATPDPTAGATHFLNPTIVRERRGGSLPGWASGEGQPIGRHVFYMPDEAGTSAEAMTLPASVLEDATLLDGNKPDEMTSRQEEDKC